MVATSAARTWRRLLGISSVLGVLQLLLHAAEALARRDPRVLVPHAVAWTQDVFLLVASSAFLAALVHTFEVVATHLGGRRERRQKEETSRHIPLATRQGLGLGRGQAPFGDRRIVLALTEHSTRVALMALGLALSLYPQILLAFLATPVSLLEVDVATARLFLMDYLGVSALWPAALALGSGLLASRHTFELTSRPSKIVLTVTVVAGALSSVGRESPNPFVFALQARVLEWTKPRTVPRIPVGPTRPSREGRSSRPSVGLSATWVNWAPAQRTAHYPHILIVVFEGTTAREFEDHLTAGCGKVTTQAASTASTASTSSSSAIPVISASSASATIAKARGFGQSPSPRALCQPMRYFGRYYTTNLDSYTSLIAMTTSVQVPFRAYAAPERYAAVNDAPNIVRGLREAGFRTLFVSTYEHQPFVPNRRDWDAVLDRNDLEPSEEWLSVEGSRMESATEDRAGLPAIEEFITTSSRTLVMAELAFGHSPEWRARTRLTPLEYYELYLRGLFEVLRRSGAKRPLIVLVSDHGDRRMSARSDNYRVPMALIGEGLASEVDRGLWSHLDFQSILAHFVLGTPMPPPRARVLVVGMTERWVYGQILANGDHVFIDDRSGQILAGSIDPFAAHAIFRSQVEDFSMAFVDARPKERGP